jgi:hypothetical protein
MSLVQVPESGLFDIYFGRGDGPLALYLRKARWICPTIHPFMDIMEAFFAGVPEGMPSDEEVELHDRY